MKVINSPSYSEIVISPFRYSLDDNIFIQDSEGYVTTKLKAVHLSFLPAIE